MSDKLVLWFLGFLETMKYILEQSHGIPPVSVALDHTTFKEEGSCGYSSVKTVRSIVYHIPSDLVVAATRGRKVDCLASCMDQTCCAINSILRGTAAR